MTAEDTEQRTDWMVVLTLALATLIVASELSLSAFALPLITAELDVSAGTSAWILLSYSIPLAAFSIPAGRWIDSADLRSVFVTSLIAVGLTSVTAAFAPTFALLLIARVLQGFAAAVHLAVCLPLIAIAVRDEHRGRAISYHATVMMLGSVALTPLGGLLADAWGWRAIFLLKVPLLFPLVWLAVRKLPRASRDASKPRPRMPLPSRTLGVEALLICSFITVALLIGEAWRQGWLMGTATALVSVFILFGWTRHPASHSTIALLRNRDLGFAILALLLMSSLTGLVTFSLPFFVAQIMHRSPHTLSAAMLFFTGTLSLVTPIAGVLADRYRPTPVAATGAGLSILGLIAMLTLDEQTGVLEIGWRTALVGIGMALFSSPNMTNILNAVPRGEAGAAGGITNLARTMGNALGPAFAAFAWSLAGGGVHGFRAGVVVLGVLTFGALAALLILNQRRS